MKRLFSRVKDFFSKGGAKTVVSRIGKAVKTGASKSWGWIKRNKNVLAGVATVGGAGWIGKRVWEWASAKEDAAVQDAAAYGVDYDNADFTALRMRKANDIRNELVKVLTRVDVHGEGSNHYNVHQQLARICELTVQFGNLLPNEGQIGFFNSTLTTYSNMADAGVLPEEPADSALMVRALINNYEDGLSIDQAENALITVISIAGSGAPLRAI